MKKILSMMVYALLILLFSDIVKAEEHKADLKSDTKIDSDIASVVYKSSDAYQYPIKPGTKEWKLIVGHDERVKACQIPESVLKTMSTAGLVETVLTYPHYGDMRAYDTLQKGFGYMSSGFNGFQELFARKDSGTVLLERYKAMDPAVFRKGFASAERGRSIWDFENVEILLVQNAIIAGLTEVQRQDLRREALLKSKIKATISSYGSESLRLTSFLADKAVSHPGQKSNKQHP